MARSYIPIPFRNSWVISTCTMCGRLYHDEDKCPEVERKYANKTNSLYVGFAAHTLLVKETGAKSFIPITKRRFRKTFRTQKKLLIRSILEARKTGKT